MYDEKIQLNVATDTIESFVICLALGTLQAIRQGTFHPDVGIWTIGRPNFWSLLEEKKLVSPEVLTVLQTGDEISAIEALGGSEEQMTAMIDRLITELETALNNLTTVREQSWYAHWNKDE